MSDAEMRAPGWVLGRRAGLIPAAARVRRDSLVLFVFFFFVFAGKSLEESTLTLCSGSAESRVVLLQDAAIHHDQDSGGQGFSRGFFVGDPFLHPDSGNSELDGLVDNLLHKLGAPKNVYDVDLLRHVLRPNIEQRSVGFFSKACVNLRIDGDNPVAVALHVGGYAVTRAERIVG